MLVGLARLLENAVPFNTNYSTRAAKNIKITENTQYILLYRGVTTL